MTFITTKQKLRTHYCVIRSFETFYIRAENFQVPFQANANRSKITCCDRATRKSRREHSETHSTVETNFILCAALISNQPTFLHGYEHSASSLSLSLVCSIYYKILISRVQRSRFWLQRRIRTVNKNFGSLSESNGRLTILETSEANPIGSSCNLNAEY